MSRSAPEACLCTLLVSTSYELNVDSEYIASLHSGESSRQCLPKRAANSASISRSIASRRAPEEIALGSIFSIVYACMAGICSWAGGCYTWKINPIRRTQRTSVTFSNFFSAFLKPMRFSVYGPIINPQHQAAARNTHTVVVQHLKTSE